MSEENTRDTQFQGFAKLLLDDLIETNAFDCLDAHMLLRPQDRAEIAQLLAKGAYDFACHIVRSQAQGIEIFCRDDPEYQRERVELIPDMTKWPKDA